MKKVVVISFIVVMFLIPAYLFSSSCGGEEGVDATEEDIQQFIEIMMMFTSVMEGEPPACVDMSTSSPSDPEGGTITFNNCDFGGVIVNGSVNLKMTSSGSIWSLSYSGSLTFSGPGAPAESITFNMTMNIDYSASTLEEALSGSGTITIDGTTFKVEGFLMALYYYGY